MKFAFYTLGCKVNLFETQALTQLAAERGHEIVEQGADAVIVNTCTVTSASDHKNIRAFHKLRRDHPDAVIAACGCFAQTEPEKVRATGEIDLVCGTQNRGQVLNLCEQAVEGKTASVSKCQNGFEYLPAGVPRGRTRALLKIEDGCDNYCAYCIIPYARGHVRSMPAAVVNREVARLTESGVREIVLTGIELSSYGRDLMSNVTLSTLMQDLLRRYPDVRFRLGSLDPRTADETFCEMLEPYGNLAKHFHLSLQSGCDSVLERMGRRYSTEEFFNNVSRLRKAFPECSITTDLIVGFPQESEQEFQETLTFLKRCFFASVHVFPYSKREGTRAASMDGQIAHTLKAERAAQAKEIANKLSVSYRQSFVGRTLNALPEHRTAGGLWAAHGDYGFPIYVKGQAIQKNHPVVIRVAGLHRDGLLAEKI
ncbi:tRNA (N(6)-L-threonylcarbamoyladenosine(37)-C(2))-methylthiotransferase MtaB [Agathobaculum sp.]|uniref:tRNA (N(6)-L-threonylcarbamoyladenosine(37)-C(2))- methylthiotransferase MtaB n=1 Tax=Agathobaculum sp. TaxID=2048138 RepID=UPI002A80247D|nr:tRNA (N(6)-L-threonylcarbamoyladenosine(37)-C(2))-methylthiotransferase MtaB [Agathobaculum sp.]MDY3617966.1 tRNA (N(6)-L-threonylcarbamoyladenosine(37)-C(2))-methylthiotransferase MtaB [Agathobaculum sp.]